MSTLNTVNITNGTDSITVEGAVKGSAKAWVNFNGTGTVAIRASYNVSSITDNGVGDYTVNFTSALVDANYIMVGAVGEYQNANYAAGTLMPHNSGSTIGAATGKTVSGIRVVALWGTNTISDSDQAYVAIFR